MPKLNSCFHRPRIEAYDIAIGALFGALSAEIYSYERKVEYEALIKKLKIERQKHAEKFGLKI